MGIRIHDFELVAITAGAVKVVKFNPSGSATDFPRLGAQAKLYSRYKIHSVSIAWVSQAATTNAAKIAFGVHAGKSNSSIAGEKSQSKIIKLNPMRAIPIWKSEGFTLGANIQSQTWLYTGSDDDDDFVAFTFYAYSDGDAGYFKFTYDISLAYPLPNS